ncbi:biotin/lipoyl-binding protein [Congregibacter brevis]|uniref:Biotin/lipoyl-binding protein n=1 Tax=Congregibacter brevis TaxID=3081201 RepID=A0ABZ0IA59_9GAMM|nr:biotin/lipoyl-binding protein [Congregibacter sp. IMCC45268]
MFELIFTSFPAVIRYFQLRKRGEAMTVWNMKTAVFLWAVMAFILFLTIFYYHPKTYAGIVPFRTVSVVSQTSGPVVEIAVNNGDQVQTGDLLFRIENSSQVAFLSEAETQLGVVDAKEAQAKDDLIVKQARIDDIEAQLVNLREELSDAETLVKRGIGTANSVVEATAQVASAEADLRAASAELDLATIVLAESIPAERRAAEAAIESAKVQLSYTEVRSFVDGTVTQLALSLGSPTTTLVFSPAMIIIPERDPEMNIAIAAGFVQVAQNVLHDGMPVEVACESNASLSLKNAIFPGRISSLQPAVATGQVVPSGDLADLKNATERGAIQAFIELEYEAHEQMLIDGSGCVIQAYTTNKSGFVGHIIAATGVVKAASLRMKVLGSMVIGVGLLGGGH